MRRVLRPHPLQWAYERRHRACLARYKREGLIVGENFISYGPLVISDPHMVRIGNNVAIAPNVHFITHDAAGEHVTRMGMTDTPSTAGPIIVHDDCGIGYGTIILPGVTIGPRAIVGAGSVVRSDVPPDTVALGNPARVATSVSALAARLDRDRGEVAQFVRGLLLERWPGRFTADQLGEDTTFHSDGLGLDSVEIVEVILACEERYAMRFPEDMLATAPLTMRRVIDKVASSDLRLLRDVEVQEGRT